MMKNTVIKTGFNFPGQKNVYKGKVDENRSIYYNKEKGVVAFEVSIDEYWVLRN